MAYLRHPIHEPRIEAAINEIADTYDTHVSVTNKAKSLVKFGLHPTLGTTPAMIWTHGPSAAEESLLTTNGITHIISSSAADTNKTVRIEYHTINGNNLTFGVQTATLNGQTAVALTTPAARISRINNTGTTNLAGNVYAYEGGTTTNGVPDNLNQVHARINPTSSPIENFNVQQTEKAATSISATDYWILTFVTADLLGSNTARVRLVLQKRATNGVWLPTSITLGLGNAGNTQVTTELNPCIIIPANHDVRMMGISSASNTTVAAYFGGYLANTVT